jgi:DNA-binding IscR family transcriptional regulator
MALLINQLSRLGDVHSRHGIGSGINLATRPADIRHCDEVELFEGRICICSTATIPKTSAQFNQSAN